MKQKKAISFIVVLAVLLSTFTSPAFASISEGSQGLVEVTSFEYVTDPGSATGDKKIVVIGNVLKNCEIIRGDVHIGTDKRNALKAQAVDEQEFVAGDTFRLEFIGFAQTAASEAIENGEGFMTVFISAGDNDSVLDLSENPYRLRFKVTAENTLDPDENWDEIIPDYRLSLSPSALSLSAIKYGETVTPAVLSLENTGWKDLNVTASISDPYFNVDHEEEIALAREGIQEYTVTAVSGLTPAAYETTIVFNTTEGISTSAAVSIEVEKNLNPGSLPAFTTVSATTVGGLGKIAGLAADTQYDIVSTDDGGAYPTWTSITADSSGNFAITPGAFQIRLSETDFYLPGDPSDDFLVKAFYHFADTVFENTKAGTYQEFDLNDYVSGGTGTKTFVKTSGLLPEGLNLDENTGIISGTPSALTTGSISIGIQVTDTDEGVKTGTVTFDKIIKGDQPTPAAVTLSATDHVIRIAEGVKGQLYFTSTNGALDITDPTAFESSGWTSLSAIEDLKRNTKYFVYSKFEETELLNESPIASPVGITTLKTTISSVTLTRSGVDAATVGAIMTPSDAAVDYVWMLDGTPVDGVTGSTITIEADMAGKELTVHAKGIGDFQGELTSSGIVIGGVSITLSAKSWNAGRPIEAVLTNETGVAVTCTAISTTAAGVNNGLTTQSIKIDNVRPNQQYQLKLTKAGCTDLIVTGIDLGAVDLTLDAAQCENFVMYCGDLNRDNAVRLEDRSLLLMSKYFGKTVADDDADMRDFNGDGWVDFIDLCLMMGSNNYGQEGLNISYTN